ncbi:MAG: iron ABC transporter substrate-binding protein [Thalassospira sp.]|uniref:Fe(3+) ABC transporter substrate-binding protein n=1 Tax=unclassified Thalassospira TaxID=2648997 RepID=UPI000C3F3406|nr:MULTISPECIES: Fe(3+) ABC transporter substrate-binding protein [unclassified Thalassospira]MBE72249.1 iron ABC transporter substrate-binding protein [Thalassospira sp.]QPO13762.1 Fe(3+) ABC transporter substrate-binding protein [Thalassospira sp. A40-3]|tara:strand:+ start:1436 stop:2461 length:1026 start_codon:yes stop_codon:yes gene_type:complete
MISLRKTVLGLVVSAMGLSMFPTAHAAEEVNVYSLRQPFLIEPMFKRFTEETGIRVNTLFSQSGLVERIKHEGRNTPADLLLTVDVGRIQDAVDADIAQPIESAVLDANIPDQFRDEEKLWVGMTTRARVLYTSLDRVEPDAITTYEELADPKWKGRICVRSAMHVYNIALIASMIAHHGEEETKTWLSAVKDNLARKPQGGDTDQIEAVSQGVCDVAIGNSYYYGKMLDDPNKADAAKQVRIVFPNQGDRGTHVNISGVALMKYAPNKENAIKLVEFLSSAEAQHMYADINFEYPVKPGVAWSERVRAWGTFVHDDLPLNTVAANRGAAIRLIDEVGFNE